MKEVSLHIKLAQDGSGYTLAKEEDSRTAFVRDDSFDTTNVIVPLTEQEREVFDERNIVSLADGDGLLVPNVRDAHFN